MDYRAKRADGVCHALIIVGQIIIYKCDYYQEDVYIRFITVLLFKEISNRVKSHASVGGDSSITAL